MHVGGGTRNLDVFEALGQPVLVEWILRDGTKIRRFEYTAPSSIFDLVLPRSPHIHTETSHHDARFLLAQPEYRVPPHRTLLALRW
jgi:hypothetical protein